tara:strand:- start:2252 stop:3055 length:804 start_codon:yes stop_codon:yes gene_type:complete
MFTPQRSGPGQMAWRDRDVGEGSGEISQGDIQEMYWKPSTIGSNYVSGPTTRRLPDPLPGTGGGPNPLAQIGRGMGELAGDDDVDMTSITETALEPGGMSSISEVMQGQAGEMSPMGYASPFGDPTADELDVYGINSPPGPGYMEGPGRTVFDDTYGSVGGMTGVPLPEQPLPPTATGVGSPMGYSMPPDESWSGGWMDEQIPMQSNRHRSLSESAPLARWLRALFSGGGPEHATPSSASSSPSARNPMPGLSSTGSDSLARHYFRS